MELTVVVGADLEGLIPAHHKASLVVLLVLEQTDVTGTTLFPLLALTVEAEQLRPHLEGLLLQFFVGLGLDLLRQTDDGLEVDIGGLRRFILKKGRDSVSYLSHQQRMRVDQDRR